MGVCSEIYDKPPSPSFLTDLEKYHGKYSLSEQQSNWLNYKELVVSGIPIAIVCRGLVYSHFELFEFNETFELQL